MLPTVIDAGAIAGGRVFRLEVPAPVEQVFQGDHFAGREQADAVTQVQFWRKVFPDGERGAAERGVVGDTGIDSGTRADAFREQVAGRAAECAGGAAEHVAFATLEAGQRFAGDQVRERFGLFHRRLRKYRQDRNERGAADLQAGGDGVVALAAGRAEDLAHRADVEAGIVERGAGEQQAPGFDREVLSVGFVGAADVQRAGAGRNPAGALVDLELAADLAVEAHASKFDVVAELDLDGDHDR